jgi:hypothetical protein
VTVADVDADPPPYVLTAPPVDRVDLTPEGAQISVGFLRFLPQPQKRLDNALVRYVQVLEYSQMPTTFQLGREVHPRNVSIVCASLAEFDEVGVPRLERAHPGNQTSARGPIRVGPVTLAEHRPTQVLEMGARETMIERWPLHTKQGSDFRIAHLTKSAPGLSETATEFRPPISQAPALRARLAR